MSHALTAFSSARASLRDSLIPALALLAVFLPLTVPGFAFVDDYTVAGDGGSNFKTLLGHGRPIYALFNLFFDNVHTHSCFASLRVLNVFLLLLSFFVSKSIMSVVGLRIFFANALAFMMVMTPGVYLFTWWATCFPQLVAVNCALLAVRFALESPARLGFSSCLVVVAMLTYQPAAMVYAIVIPLGLLKEGKFAMRTFCLRSIPYFASMFCGFAAIKAFSGYASANRGIIHLEQVAGKLKWYFSSALPNSVCLGAPIYSGIGACVGAAAIFLGLIFLFKRCGGVGLAIAFAGILAASAPILLNGENWASSRALMALFVYFTCLAAFPFAMADASPGVFIGKVARYVLVLICSATGFMVSRTLVTHIVYPQLAEASYVASAIRDAHADFSKEVFVIPSSWEYAIAPSVSYDEFGSVSAVSWNSIAMMKFQARRLGVPIHKLTLIAPDDAGKYPESQVVDLRKMKSLRVVE